MARRSADSSVWLSSLEVEGFRCFKDRQVVRFATSDGQKAQWTLLLGENGTGKSTLLQLCALLIPREWNEKSVTGARTLFDNGGFLGYAAPRRDMAAQLCLSLRVGALEHAIAYEVNAILSALSMTPLASQTKLQNLPRLPLCLAYAPYRSPRAFLPEDTSPELARGLLIGFTRLRHPGIWFKDRTFAAVNPDSTERSRETAADLLQTVRRTLLALLPDVEDLRIDTEKEGRGDSRLRAKTSFGWVEIDKLGMGYQSVLGLIVDIASRLVEYYPDSPNPLEEPAIVLIDEVDLHLHPKWQRTLQEQLSSRFPNVQFIATAHSPLVVQASPSANIVVLRSEGDHVVIETAPDEVKTWRADQILTSDLFGLPSARPPALDSLLEERDGLLAQSTLSSEDERRLSELRKQIGELPGGETPWQMEAMELIQKAAKKLKPAEPKAKKRNASKARGA